MRGNVAVIRLLLDHGADPAARDSAYDATPAGWAEHHGQPEAQRLLETIERPDGSAPLGAPEAGPIPSSPTGTAMRTVAAAFTAVSEGRFDELEGMLAEDIDWRGLPDEDGQIPGCRGRAQALARMRIGLLANREVSVSALLEEGDRVLAHVHRVAGDDLGPPERFLVAEVHHGQITDLRGYATEVEARDALEAE
jgi:ketosteroid isomerase-like protein